MAPLDGTAKVEGGGGASVVTDAALTCSLPGNVICVAVTANDTDVASVTGGGVTFTRRAQRTSGGEHVEFWTGYAAGTFNASITVNATGSFGFVTVHAFAFNGPPSSAYFDVNASLPDIGGTDPRAVSTTASDTIIVGVFRMSGTASPTQGSGYTLIYGGGYQLTEYMIVSAPQSALSVTIGTGVGDSNGAIGDALLATSGGGGATTNLRAGKLIRGGILRQGLR